MPKLLKRFVCGLFAIIVCAIYLSSCSSDSNQTRYVAAKLVDSDMWSIVDVKTGEIIHKDEFKSQPSVIVNGKFVVKNESGLYDYFSVDNVTKPINSEGYLCASSFSDNDVALVVLKGQGISVINGKCETIATLDNSIVTAFGFSNGYAVVVNDEQKCGYINEKGDVVVKLDYDGADPFSEDGYAIVSKKVNDTTSKYIAIDTKGTELFSFSSNEYKNHGAFVNGYIPVQRDNDEVVLLDKTGKKLCSIGKWDGFIPYWLGFNDDVIVFQDGDAYGLKNDKGEIVMRAKYDELMPLPKINPNYYWARKQDKYGIVDKDDKVIIPFDYTVLGYINKDVLLVGEGKSFSFIDKDFKDVGQNNYTNLSVMTGTSIRSNYLNTDKEVRKIIENITDSTFYNTKAGMHLRDFKDKLSGDTYYYMNDSTLVNYQYPFMFLYGFDQTLFSERNEYIYDYRYPTSPEYNYNVNLAFVVVSDSSYKEFQLSSVEALAKAFDSLIQKQGFKPVDGKPNWFKNDKTGMCVALAYDDDSVSVMCAYIDEYMSMEAKRDAREEASKADVQVDYVDIFGFETVSDTAVVEEAVAVDTVL